MTSLLRYRPRSVRPLVIAVVTLGVGLGAIVDGIVLHHVFQWHHMLTAWDHGRISADTVEGLRLNTLADGLFHSTAWVATALGLAWLWRAVKLPETRWSALAFVGALLAGWGGFNLVEGLINHHLLGLHHVRDDLGGPLAWDLGFLALGAAQLVAGMLLIRAGGREEPPAR